MTKIMINNTNNKIKTITQLMENSNENSLIMKLLYEIEAETLNTKYDNTGLTILHLAAMYNNIEAVKYIISKISSFDNQDNLGETALHLAATYHNVEVAQLLIEKGADVNFQNLEGETPLHVAVNTENEDKGNIEIIKLLIAKGADANLKNLEGQTPFEQEEIYPALLGEETQWICSFN